MARSIRLAIAFAVMVAAAGQVQASILHFDDFAGSNQITQALTSLGQSATGANHGNFSAVLASGSWDLVIVDISGSGISSTNQNAIINYINDGGKVLMSYWDLDTAPALAGAFGVVVASSFSTPLNVFAWNPSHSVFNSPFAVTSPVTFSDSVADDGDRLMGLVGGTAIAGFTTSPTANQAAIVLGNGNRTIVNGWLFDELNNTNGVGLAANEINYLLNSSDASVPEPTSLALCGIGALGMIFGARRRRQQTTAV